MSRMSKNAVVKAFLMQAVGAVSLLVAGEAAGKVVTPGRMLINSLPVQGNATVMQGSVLKTVATAARVELASGAVLSLDAHSEAVVRGAGVELRRGRGIVADDAGGIEALGLRVDGAVPHSQVLVEVTGSKIEVAAVRGSGRVRNSHGVTLAMVQGGKPLSFEPGPETDGTLVTGKLQRIGAKYILRDELTGMEFELRGRSLSDHEGARVEAGGNSQIAGGNGAHVVLVSRLSRLETPTPRDEAPRTASGSSSSSAAKAGAAKAGISAGTKIGIAALAFGGLAAAISVPLAMSN